MYKLKTDFVFISEDVLFEGFSSHLPAVWAADIQCRFVVRNQTGYRKYCIMNIFFYFFIYRHLVSVGNIL